MRVIWVLFSEIQHPLKAMRFRVNRQKCHPHLDKTGECPFISYGRVLKGPFSFVNRNRTETLSPTPLCIRTLWKKLCSKGCLLWYRWFVNRF
ncbi:hypothetical protein CEXT_152481 [Caerostris extrusa]|uniref:Uncharacterized protein n=1 Tax=Caerostris extrusa TaxID=172846 RepID=A0AAV4WRA6_CAEEX|nr:hypothetical protein CEXT_152481 [Caerostris extrusa]